MFLDNLRYTKEFWVIVKHLIHELILKNLHFSFYIWIVHKLQEYQRTLVNTYVYYTEVLILNIQKFFLIY